MTTEQIIGLALALLVMAVGFAGCLLPALPGTPLVLAAAVGHRLYFGGQHSITTLVLIVLIIITIISVVLDHVAGVYGAKRFGATWRGMLGAAVGGIVGLFFNLPGLLLGPFIGAALFEAFGGYEFKKATKAGVGATIGFLGGVVGKCAACVAMIGLFAANVIWRSV